MTTGGIDLKYAQSVEYDPSNPTHIPWSEPPPKPTPPEKYGVVVNGDQSVSEPWNSDVYGNITPGEKFRTTEPCAKRTQRARELNAQGLRSIPFYQAEVAELSEQCEKSKKDKPWMRRKQEVEIEPLLLPEPKYELVMVEQSSSCNNQKAGIANPLAAAAMLLALAFGLESNTACISTERKQSKDGGTPPPDEGEDTTAQPDSKPIDTPVVDTPIADPGVTDPGVADPGVADPGALDAFYDALVDAVADAPQDVVPDDAVDSDDDGEPDMSGGTDADAGSDVDTGTAVSFPAPILRRPYDGEDRSSPLRFFSWEAQTPAGKSITEYEFCLADTDPTPLQSGDCPPENLTSFTPSTNPERGAEVFFKFAPNTDYYWAVKACFDDASCSPMSNIWLLPINNSAISCWENDDETNLGKDTCGENHGVLLGKDGNPPPEPIDGALSFAGNNYVEVPNHTTLNPTNAIGIETWVNRSPNGNYNAVVSKGYLDTDGGYALRISEPDSNPIAASFSLPGLGSTSDPSQYGNISDNTWTQLVGTYDGQTQNMFVNGALSFVQILTGNIGTNDLPLRVGFLSTSSNKEEPFQGQIDRVVLYTSPPATEEIQENHCALKELRENDPLPDECFQ